MAERVLVAHPDPDERARLTGIAAAAGLEAIEARDGEEAVSRGRGVMLALVAARLPRGDGLSTALRLRGGEDEGPRTVLLNDVYPVNEPKERFLRDFGLAQVVAAPASDETLGSLLARRDRWPWRPRKEAPPGTDLADTPLVLLLARARRKLETGFLFVRRAGEALFLVLNQGDIAQVTGNRAGASDELSLLGEGLLWPDGEAFLYPDPAVAETSPARIDLLPIIERTAAPPLPEVLAEAARRSLARASRVMFQPAEGQAELADLVGLSSAERELLTLIDGERSVARLSALAEAGCLPLAALLFRLEVLGFIARRRPGQRAAGQHRPLEAPAAALWHEPAARIEAGGWLEPGDLARLLLRLEMLRATGVLAVKRAGRTLEMALGDGRITGAHAWGGAAAEDDPMQLAALGELRPEDVPALRRLHARRLVLDALRVPDCDYTLRKGEVYRMAETLGVNPASLVVELFRAGEMPVAAGAPPPAERIDALAAAMSLTVLEGQALRRHASDGEAPTPAWLAGLGLLLDPATPIGGSGARPERALPAAPPEVLGKPAGDLETLFQKALDEGLAEGARAGARRAHEMTPPPAPASAPSVGATSVTAPSVPAPSVTAPSATAPSATAPSAVAPPATAVARTTDPAPLQPDAARILSSLPPRPPRDPIPALPEEDVPEDLRAFELTLGSGQGSPASFSMEQRSGGVVIRVGDREYAIDLLIRDVEELRRERNRLRGELVRRHTLLVEREDEVESVRKTLHELENFIHELQATVTDKERAFHQLVSSRGESDAMLAELQAVVPEKDRLLEEAIARAEHVEGEIGRVRERIRERERALEDLRRERDGLKERAARLDAELRARTAELHDGEERIGVLDDRAARLEQDLAASRFERDELTARLAAAESDRKPKGGFFRDARAEKTAVDERVERSEKLAEERRRALDQVRAELVTVSHRAIDLEGQVARRDAEVARLHRERERLEEKLASALAEAKARGEAEAANLARREEAERVLRERSTALELKNDELTGLRRLHDQVSADLASTRERLGERERSIEALQEQRSQLRARLGEVEAERSTLATELATLREERDRLQGSNEEVRQTAERATSALEAVRAARDEIGLRLAETIAEKSRTEEERERFLAEGRRLEGALSRERDLRAEEQAALSGKLAAREEELHALGRRLQSAQSEAGALNDRLGALLRERDEAVARLQSTEQKLAAASAEVLRLGRETQVLAVERQRAHELADTLSARDAMVLELEGAIQEKQGVIDRQTLETAALLDRLQARKLAIEEKRRQEMIAFAEGKRREVDQISQRHKEEMARLTMAREAERTERDRVLEQVQEQALATEEKLHQAGRTEADLRAELGNREGQVRGLQGELEKASHERRRLAEELEGKVAAKVLHVQKLEAGLARLKEEATRELTNWRTRARELEQRVATALAEEAKLKDVLAAGKQENERLEAQVAGARKRIAQDVRRISELVALADDQRARIGERDVQIEALRAELSRRQEDAERLEAELASRGAEVDAFREAAADSERKLAETNERAFALSQHDRELSQQLAEQEELIANLKADVPRLGREKESALAELERTREQALSRERARTALTDRIAALEREVAERTENEARLRSETDALLEEVAGAAEALAEADSQAQETLTRLGGPSPERAAQEKNELVQQLRELEAKLRASELAIADRDEAYDLLDATLAARERLVEELERRLVDERAAAQTQRAASPSGAGVEQRLRLELEEAASKLAEAASERDARETLKRALETALREKELVLDEVRRLRAAVRAGDPLPAAPTGLATAASWLPAAAAQPPDLETATRDKQELIEASSRYHREVTRLREAMERKSQELSGIESALQDAGADADARRELTAARQAAEDEVHALQASLGVATVKMAEMNRVIVEKNRMIQQLIEHDRQPRPAAQTAEDRFAAGESAIPEPGIETADRSESEAGPGDARADQPAPPEQA